MEQNELKLDMTPDEVTAILGEPDDTKEEGWNAFSCYYVTRDEEENIKIRFIDDKVVHITRWSKGLNIEE